jgi:hypothetical protein
MSNTASCRRRRLTSLCWGCVQVCGKSRHPFVVV